MSVTSKPIITQILRKTGMEGGVNIYTTYDIGTQLQYIKSIINSNNHNFEEQILIGTDADTKFTQEIFYEDEEVPVPFIEDTWVTNFRIQGSYTEFYQLITVRKRNHKIHYANSTGTLTVRTAPEIYKEKKELYYCVLKTLNPSTSNWFEYDETITPTYSPSSDTSVIGSKIYYGITASSSIQPAEGHNPHDENYFELDNGVYTLTSDTTVDSGKTYYLLDVIEQENIDKTLVSTKNYTYEYTTDKYYRPVVNIVEEIDV